MHGLDSLTHERPDYRAKGEDIGGPQLIDAFVGTLRLDDCVKIAAVGDIYYEAAKARDVDFHASGCHVGRNITDGDTGDLVTLGRVLDPDDSRRHLQAEAHGRSRPDQPVLQRKGDETNRSITTQQQTTAGFYVLDGRVVGGVDRRD